ncbi:hypothetical protein PHISP_00818 [Aspergillus sp. HF37]|nr:hypothetical protein PHISP_00818 [Aspergillus sp. HF37]
MARKHSTKHASSTGPDAPRSQSSALLNGGLNTPCDFLLPTEKIQSSTIDSAKYFLDPLALALNEAESAKRQDNRKRKRSAVDEDQALQLGQLYVEGFTSDQIWEQAVRILDSAGKGIHHDYGLSARYRRNLPSKIQAASPDSDGEYEDTEIPDADDVPSSVEGSADESDDSDDEDAGMEPEAGDEDSVSEGSKAGEIDGATDETPAASDTRKGKPDAYTRDRFGLNDGFFSIDDFNKQSQFFENSDAKGGQNDHESDDDEVDWDANPLAGGLGDSSDAEGGDGSSDEEDGPTFDDAHTPGEPDVEDDYAESDGGEEDDTNQIDAGDSEDSDDAVGTPGPPEPISENDVNRAADDVRRDLFDDEMSDDGGGSEAGPAERRADRSGHEKQRAKIADEIRRLEAANVEKKEWMVAGEARAAERPMNSLIEEDLDFERIGKPVPVVTNEVSEGIEDLVKRRILAKEFDEVIRRHPGVSDGPGAKRGRVELDDSKPKESLTELYEADHLRATAPNYVDPKNQKLMRVHAELTAQWKEISSQLDTLSNYHYKPNAPQADINVVPDVATVTMEDARPTAGGSLGGAALAPQEIYAPGDNKDAGELTLKTGAPMAKDEMTREAKGKLRRQHKKQKKAHGGGQAKRQPAEGADKESVVSDLKKGGVKVIGKEGEVTDVHGNKPKQQGRGGADTLKL